MGAEVFYEQTYGKTASEAFSSAYEAAAWECGHGGYTGTIAEKGGFKIFNAPEGISPKQFANDIMEYDGGGDLDDIESAKKDLAYFKKAWAVFDDKWGDAVCVPTGEKNAAGEELFLFIGYASS